MIHSSIECPHLCTYTHIHICNAHIHLHTHSIYIYSTNIRDKINLCKFLRETNVRLGHCFK